MGDFRQRSIATVLIVAGTTGFSIGVLCAYLGLRGMLATDSRFCTNGGPYAITPTCSGRDILLLAIGTFGALICAALYARGSAVLGRSVTMAGLLAQAAAFGILGWAFVSRGLQPAGHGGSAIWLVIGALSWLLALGGVAIGLRLLSGDLRKAGPGAASAWTWVAASMAGTVVGVMVSAVLAGGLSR